MVNIVVDKIKIKHGLKTNLPILDNGEPAYCTDTKEYFIGTIDGNVPINDLSEINNQLMRTVNGFKPGHSVWTEFELRGINVEWFGADYYDETNKKYYADESMTIAATDNSAAFQSAVDYLSSIGGGTLFVPRGNYVFRTNVKWKSQVSMIGAGVSNTIFYVEGYVFNLFINLDGPHDGSGATDADFLKDVRFENFQCDLIGLTKTEWDVNGKAFFILHMKRARFNNLLLKNTIGTALGCDFLVDSVISNVVVYRAGRNVPTGEFAAGNSGIGVGTDAYEEETLIISNCHTYECGNYGIFVETQEGTEIRSKYAKVIGCHAHGNRLGFGNKGSGGTQFIGCSASENYLHGFHLTQQARGDQLIGCVSERNGGDGVRIEADYIGDLEISSSRMLDNTGAGIRALTSVNAEGLQNLILDSIQAKSNGLSGILFEGGVKNLLINGVSAFNNGQKSTTSNRGILVTGMNDGVSILNSLIKDSQAVTTQKAGIQVNQGTSNLLLDSNNVIGYTASAAYQILTTGGRIGVNAGLITEAGGMVTFPDGIKTLYVNHYLGKAASYFVVTPTANNSVWVIDNTEPNRTRIERETTAGELNVYWKAER